MMHGHSMGGPLPPPTPPTKRNLSKRTKFRRPQAGDDPKPLVLRAKVFHGSFSRCALCVSIDLRQSEDRREGD